MIGPGRASAAGQTPAPGLLVDRCNRCACTTPPRVVARDLERDSIIGGYRCASCGASWFTSYRLGADELAQVLAARRAAARA